MVEIKMNVTHCYQCPFHKVVPDPDPTDWFNVDDVSLLCTKCPNDTDSRYWASDKPFEYKPVSVSDRPYQIKNNKTPDWCPFKNQ